MRTEAEIKEFIRRTIIEEMNITNIISQSEPVVWVPLFIDTLSTKINDLVLDEIAFRKRI